MGSVCCCLRPEDFEDYMNPSSNLYRNHVCLGCFVQNFLHMYTTLFQRQDLRSVPSSIQGMASMNSSASIDNSLSDMYCSTLRPLPYDADATSFHLRHDGLVSRHEKGSSHLQDESEPLRGEDDADYESLSTGDKWHACEQGLKEKQSKSSQKLSSTKASVGTECIYSSVEEEEACPTCLEEYTPENPKIVTKCSHHFHLGCIYEWMERSEHCPLCGKVSLWMKTSNNRRHRQKKKDI